MKVQMVLPHKTIYKDFNIERVHRIDGAKHLNRTLLSNSSGVVEDSQDYPPTGLDSDEYDEYDEYGDYAEYRFVQI
ncbi:hypothetical protein CHS0354_020703 [Potamilus streckersoni]|uniref:Uncharacterized protein n=1 Tax=Potamilus streckersoni TaxID=2493646 RepID=A0AAE0TG32_9BIVA|nr:hypothetical protein CHS0354_020703 [Potamilus streckersoni]